MSIAITCPSCHRQLKAPDTLAGRTAKCPHCRHGVTVPAPMVDFGIADDQGFPSRQSRRRQSGRIGRWVTWALLITGAILPFGFGAVWVSYLANQWAEKRALATARESAQPQVNSRGFPATPASRRIAPIPPAVKPKESPPKPAKPDWKSVTAEVETPELHMSLKHAIAVKFYGESFGRSLQTQCLCIRLRVENKTKTKLIRWRGWQGEGAAEDEFANQYKPHLPSFRFDMSAATNPSLFVPSGRNYVLGPDTFGLREEKERQCACNWTGDCGGSIGPDKVYLAILYWEVPIESATEIRLAMPASAYDPDSTVMHRFRLPISRELSR